ncbi:MAG: pyridoxine 5'-phosphate synthase [Candidatus Omnitrophota bacterium]
MKKLGINIDHVATLRQARRGREPDPVLAALICELAGADSIVAHLREDRRHINERDLRILKQTLKTKLNLEMSVSQDVLKIACGILPGQATLVPEKRQELTTEGGLDAVANFKKIKTACAKLENKGIPVSLFINPDIKQIDAACKLGVGKIELHTGKYADSRNDDEQKIYLEELKTAAEYAFSQGLQVFAGHGLNYHNVKQVSRIKCIEELNIGHSVICQALIVGLEKAVRQMKALI